MTILGRQLWPDNHDYMVYGPAVLVFAGLARVSYQEDQLIWASFFALSAAVMVHCTIAYWRWNCALKWSKRAVIAIKEGNYESALRDLDLCLKRDPEWVECIFNKGVALWNSGNLQDALPWLRHALELDPSNREIQEVYTKSYHYLVGRSGDAGITHIPAA